MADNQGSAKDAGQKGDHLREDPGAAVYVGAALTGAGNAVEKKMNDLGESARKAFGTGDMRIENAPHPVDAVQAGVQKLTDPSDGDMRLEHSPHPVDEKLADLRQTVKKIEAVDSVEGTVIGASAVMTAVIENVGPGKKIGLVADLVDDAKDAHKASKAIDGELLPAEGVAHQQNLATAMGNDMAAYEPPQPKSKLDQAKQAVLHPYETLLDKIAPPTTPSERMSRAVHDSRPSMLDNMNGQSMFLNEEQALRHARQAQILDVIERGGDLGKRVEQAIGRMNEQQLKELLSSNKYDAMLDIHEGIRPSQQVSMPSNHEGMINRFESPGEVNEPSKLKRAFEYIGPQNPSDEKLAKFAKELEQGNLGNAVIMQGSGVGKAWVGLGGSSVAAALAVNHYIGEQRESDLAKLPPNERLARTFESTAGNAKLEKDHPELQSQYDKYHKEVESALKRHPSVGGRSDDASSEIFKAKQDISNDIKQHGLDKSNQRSSIDGLTPEQKVAQAESFIKTLPEHQQGAYREKVAEFANQSGLKVAEQHVPPELGVQPG